MLRPPPPPDECRSFSLQLHVGPISVWHVGCTRHFPANICNPVPHRRHKPSDTVLCAPRHLAGAIATVQNCHTLRYMEKSDPVPSQPSATLLSDVTHSLPKWKLIDPPPRGPPLMGSNNSLIITRNLKGSHIKLQTQQSTFWKRYAHVRPFESTQQARG
jgi:hypothetical protein